MRRWSVSNKVDKPSLDRIDSSLGYIQGNLQLVTIKVNKMKSNFSDAEFMEICRNVSDWEKLQYNCTVGPGLWQQE